MSVTWNTDAEMTPTQAAEEHAAQDAVRRAVRDALLAAGAAGLTTQELYAIGPSAVRRLNELRSHGYDYTRTYVGRRSHRYVLFPVTAPPRRRARRSIFGPDADRIVAEAARILRARRQALAAAARPATLF